MPRERRPKGEGSIYESPKGSGRWWARLPKDEHGKNPKRRAQSEADAYKVLKQLEHERALQLSTAKRPTFEDYATHWLEEQHQHIKVTTWHIYEKRIRKTLIPEFGKLRMHVIQRPKIQQWVNKRATTNAVNTVKNDLRVLDTIFELAVTDRLIPFNPVKDVRLPKQFGGRTPVVTVALDFTQVGQLLAIAEAHRLYALYIIALVTGMRQGELLGLRWANVVLEGAQPCIRVVEQIQFIQQQFVIVTPKSKRSRRDIPIDAAIIQVLRAHRVAQYAERLEKGTDWHDHDLLFPTATGVPLRGSALRAQFQVLAKRAGLSNVRFHDLRHTAGSLMLDRGIELLAVSELLGHSSVELTARIYAHSYEANRLRAVSAVMEGIQRIRGAI